jgi:tetratricopeptide (TPR) repeat protein
MCKSLAKEGRRDEANKIVDNLLKIREQDWRNQKIKAWLLNDSGKHDEAIKAYEAALSAIGKDDALEGDQKKQAENEVRLEMLSPLAKQKKLAEADKIIDDMFDPKERYRINLELKADVFQEAGNMEGVGKIYQQLVERVGKDEKLDKSEKTELDHRYRYILSSVYVEIDDLKKAISELEYLIAADPDNPSYNNDLGFLWADHDQNLDKAEKMIRKALDEDRKRRKAGQADSLDDDERDKAAYLDSMGWVLFKKKNYPEAKKFIIEATKERDGQHVEILDHLGDIHMAMGEKNEAVAVWKKALKLETPSKRDKQRKTEIEKKIKATENKVVSGKKAA